MSERNNRTHETDGTNGSFSSHKPHATHHATTGRACSLFGVIAQEIADDLETALVQFATIADDLKELQPGRKDGCL